MKNINIYIYIPNQLHKGLQWKQNKNRNSNYTIIQPNFVSVSMHYFRNIQEEYFMVYGREDMLRDHRDL